MLGLRTTDGVDLDRVRERFGVDLLADNQAVIHDLEDDGRLHFDEPVIRPTRAGHGGGRHPRARLRPPRWIRRKSSGCVG